MDLILIVAYLALLHDIYIMVDAVISIGYYFNKYELFLFLSETCNGLNFYNCLSCYSPNHLYNGIILVN